MLERTPLMLRTASAFGELRGSAEPDRAGLWARERRLQMATVMAYKGKRAELTAKLIDKYGLTLPDGPRRAANGTAALLGLGPRTFLFQRETGSSLEPELALALGDAAAVTDQSDGYAVLRLSGPRVRAVLEKCVSIDLHERVFAPGSVASTSCAHLGVILWRLDDDAGFAVFEMAVFRSFARSLWHFIEESAVEFGLAIVKEGT
jgi:methylglutamate dehydrogenase subunit D